MDWRDLFHWWNAIYSVPLLFALIYLGVSLLLGTLAGDHDAEHDAHAEADAHADVHADAGVDHDAAVDADADHDLEAGHDVAHGAGHADAHHGHPHHHGGDSPLLDVLAFLGVGRAPLGLVLQIFMVVWGVVGLSIHSMVGAGSPLWLALSAPLSLVLSAVATRGLAFAFGKVVRKETYALARSEFVGTTGRVVFPVTAEEGTIHFRDRHGTLHRVRARSQHERLESGQEVVILGYDPAQNVYQVDDAVAFVRRRD
jgi:membrane protein implicated in regulation of membrane protease activity